jgi:hypothetical protein
MLLVAPDREQAMPCPPTTTTGMLADGINDVARSAWLCDVVATTTAEQAHGTVMHVRP